MSISDGINLQHNEEIIPIRHLHGFKLGERFERCEDRMFEVVVALGSICPSAARIFSPLLNGLS
jgi:hypothetical protein